MFFKLSYLPITAFILTLSLSAAASSFAGETQKYTYDAKGRLVKVERSGNVNSGVESEYTYDKVDNRINVTTTGAASSNNSPPVDVYDFNLVVPECAVRQRNVVANDTDPENNTPITIVSASLSGDGVQYASIVANNTRIEFTGPSVSARTFYTVNYIIQDSLGATSPATITIDVRDFGNSCS